MAQFLYFSRDTKLYAEFNGTVFNIPVLDGYSFSQATNATEITLNEMEASGGGSRRGRRAFNDSLAPGEWSFSTYARPFASTKTSGANGGWGGSNVVHAIEEVLWASMLGADTYTAGAPSLFKRSSTSIHTAAPDGTDNTLGFGQSNFSTLGTLNLYFVIGTPKTNDATQFRVYKLSGATVNEASIDFDIDGIATINWSGNCNDVLDFTNKTIAHDDPPSYNTKVPTGHASRELTVGDVFLHTNATYDSVNFFDQLSVCTNATNGSEAFTPVVNELTDGSDSASFIRNRLTQLTIATSSDDQGSGMAASYTATLTGGNITITNNNTYITPEELGVVNTAIGHVTGTRTVGGSFTCYLSDDSANVTSSSDFFRDIKDNLSSTVTNSFALTFSIGGASGRRVALAFPTAHVEIPSISIEDVISLETTFSALPSTIDNTDEVTINYLV